MTEHNTGPVYVAVVVQVAKVTYQVMVVMGMLGWSSSVQVRGFTKQCR